MSTGTTAAEAIQSRNAREWFGVGLHIGVSGSDRGLSKGCANIGSGPRG